MSQGTVNVNGTAKFGNYAMNHRQTQAGAGLRAAGGKEWLKQMIHDFGRYAFALITDAEHQIMSWSKLAMGQDARGGQVFPGKLNAQCAP